MTAADEATQLASLQAAIRRLNIHNYEDANIEGWIPDTSTGNSVADLTAADEATQLASLQAAIRRLNIHNLNTGYMKCKEVFNIANGVANRHGGWIKWPLGPLFAFVES